MVINKDTYAVLGLPLPRHLGAVLPPVTSTKAGARAMPLLHRRILSYLSAKATDAPGYTAIHIDGCGVEAMDDAIGTLYRDGLLNAFFIAQSARPRFHPSSLTREGRRTFDRLLKGSQS
jgi:hypothetical protein